MKTKQQVTTLTEMEREALGEIANIAMGRAANSIRLMVGHQVLLSVPAAEILSKEDAAQAVATPDNRILDQRFLGSNHIRPRPQVCRTKYG
jgi:chemotaxis protein CheY-P-specific phosphatase CheC